MEIFKLVEERKRISAVLVDLVFEILSQSLVMLVSLSLVFEICVGLYFPMMGTLKGQIVPEESRAGIYNLYRLPLNVIVVQPWCLKFTQSPPSL